MKSKTCRVGSHEIISGSAELAPEPLRIMQLSWLWETGPNHVGRIGLALGFRHRTFYLGLRRRSL